MPKADEAQVRALVAAYAPSNLDVSAEVPVRALALRAEAEWSGPAVVQVAGRSARVVACLGPLAVRTALIEHADDAELLVLLTPCSATELGLDVRLRLVKGDVIPLDPFSSVLALFGASTLDPQLGDERWLIDDLIALAPATGWPNKLPSGGMLDIDVAWRAWHHARLGLELEPPDLASLLHLGERPGFVAALTGLSMESRERLADRWVVGVGGAARVVVELMVEGHGPDLISLGLVAGTLWATTDQPGLVAMQGLARARLEKLFGRDELDVTSATGWAVASSALLGLSDSQAAIVDAAEQYLTEAGAGPLVALSDVLPAGFDLRLRAVGEALLAGDAMQAAEALSWAERHRLAGRRGHRLLAAQAAIALMRRRAQPAGPRPTTFASATAAYAEEGAFLDEAARLVDEGESVPALASAYDLLSKWVQAERARSEAAFADLLGEWSRSEPVPDERVVPLEHLLAEVVARVAVDAPVLLVVCDGMGIPVAHQLLRDLAREHWASAAPEGRTSWPVGVALLPTVTEASRTSLLSGARMVGGQVEERKGFTAHPALAAASKADRPPVLFHKAALVGPSGLALPDDVRAVVADPDQRVVGVVVNSVDDHLARGDQVRVGWDLASLRPLGWLLDAAAEAGRVVVLTADHGHVLHGPGSVCRVLPGGGERWRTVPPGAGDGEIEIAGPRVLLGDGRVVLPSGRGLRYGGHKHGYHGGATPEEVLVPVEVIARRLPPGWHHYPPFVPGWWTGQGTTALPVPQPRAVAPPGISAPAGVAKAALKEAPGQPKLFDPAPHVAPPEVAAGKPVTVSWVENLLSSPSFVANRQRVRLPRPISDDRLRGYLMAVEANGGQIPLDALSVRTGEPADTLRMALSLVQRLVNLEGSGILTIGADGTVRLDRQLAALQFQLGTS